MNIRWMKKLNCIREFSVISVPFLFTPVLPSTRSKSSPWGCREVSWGYKEAANVTDSVDLSRVSRTFCRQQTATAPRDWLRELRYGRRTSVRSPHESLIVIPSPTRSLITANLLGELSSLHLLPHSPSIFLLLSSSSSSPCDLLQTETDLLYSASPGGRCLVLPSLAVRVCSSRNLSPITG